MKTYTEEKCPMCENVWKIEEWVDGQCPVCENEYWWIFNPLNNRPPYFFFSTTPLIRWLGGSGGYGKKNLDNFPVGTII